jgi:hypothetical protein
MKIFGIWLMGLGPVSDTSLYIEKKKLFQRCKIYCVGNNCNENGFYELSELCHRQDKFESWEKGRLEENSFLKHQLRLKYTLSSLTEHTIYASKH